MNTMKTLSLVMLTVLSSSLGAKPVVKKSKEAAAVKAIVGSGLAVFGFQLSVVKGIPNIMIAHSQHMSEKKIMYYGTLVGFATMYQGYTIAQNALQDLEEIAQYE